MSLLAIASLQLAGGGVLGIVPCPAAGDASRLRDWRPDAVLSLVEPGPRAEAAGAICRALGVARFHLPIADFSVPDATFEAGWTEVGPVLRRRLRDRGRVLVHCLGGQGRSGMIAARLLVELDEAAADAAIALVRRVRPGAIETADQAAHVRGCRPLRD